MDYKGILEELKVGKIRTLYLLHGEEDYLSRQIEKDIVDVALRPDEKDMNLTVLDHDPAPRELASLIESIPFMGDRQVIIIRGTKLFHSRRGVVSEEQVTGQEVSDDPFTPVLSNIPEYSCVIFTTTDKVDKRRKIYKATGKYGIIVESAPLKIGEVRDWITHQLAILDKKMDPKAMEYFLGIIGVMPQISLGFLANELDKLALFTLGRRDVTLRDMEAVLSSIPEISVFVMIEALSQKNISQALKFLSEQLAAGDHPLKILTLITRQVRLLWQAKEISIQGLDSRVVAAQLGVPFFVGEKLMRQSKGFSVASLKQAFLSLAEADYELKSGKATSIVLENILIGLCR